MALQKIEVFPTANDEWAFRFVAGNGEKIAQSETYKSPGHAAEAAILVSTGFVSTPITLIPKNA